MCFSTKDCVVNRCYLGQKLLTYNVVANWSVKIAFFDTRVAFFACFSAQNRRKSSAKMLTKCVCNNSRPMEKW